MRRGLKTKYKLKFFFFLGITDSAPVVILMSDDECTFHLEWHTAAACVQTQIFGTNCRLSDDISGKDGFSYLNFWDESGFFFFCFL